MIRIAPEALARWRIEIDRGVEFRDKEFGTYHKSMPGSTPQPQTSGAGRNLEAFEQGARSDDWAPPLNLIFPIVKNVVPTLFYQNPKAFATPDEYKAETAGEDAFYAGQLINRDIHDPAFRFKDTLYNNAFDTFVLGFGVSKIGYSTEFGVDVLRTEGEEHKQLREKLKERVQQLVAKVGLGKPPEAPVEVPISADESIRAERAYVAWVSPFDFVIDPRARSIYDARWVAQRIRKTLEEVKADRRYSQAKHDLVAESLDDARVPVASVEAFQAVDVWEVHYKTADSETGIRVLTFAATQDQTKALAHEDSLYQLSGGWQYELAALNKHGHRLYPISVLSIIRPTIDRIYSTLDAVIEQLDKFVAKVAFNERVTADGQLALDTGEIGARVKISGQEDVRSAIAVISMDQVKLELMNFINALVDMVILVVGLTRAQLTGLTTAQTATEAQIGQGGQNLRRGDESNFLSDFTNRVVTKLWLVKAQFQDFENVTLDTGESALNPQTGVKQFSFYPPIDAVMAQRLKQNRYRFHLEVGSTQKPNLEIVRAQFEQFARALMEPIVTNGLALEGKRLSASEIIRQWSRFFEEYGIQDVGKMIVPINDPTMQQSLLGFGQKPEPTNGTERLTGSVPNMADLTSAAAGEKGQGVPLV